MYVIILICAHMMLNCRDFRYNSLSNISGSIDPPANVTIRLEANPVCNFANQLNISQFCGRTIGDNDFVNGSSSNSIDICKCSSSGFEHVPNAPIDCLCGAPLGVQLRLRSPSFVDFRPYINTSYKSYITSNLNLDPYQLLVDPLFIWEDGPRLLLRLKFFPQYNISNGSISTFNLAELYRIVGRIATFSINSSELFGPYELLNFEEGIYTIGICRHKSFLLFSSFS